MQHFARALHRFEIGAAVIPEPEVQAFSDGRLLDDVCVAFELIADGRPDEIRAVGIKPLLHHEIDLTEVDIAKVDRDLLVVRDPGAEFTNMVVHQEAPFDHPSGWLTDVMWMFAWAFQGEENTGPSPTRAVPLASVLSRVQRLAYATSHPCPPWTKGRDRFSVAPVQTCIG